MFEKEREYRIPFSTIPKGMKLNNWGRDTKTNFSMSMDIFEDKEGFFYKIKLNEKKAKDFEILAKLASEAEKVPLYTFRCHKCRTLFPLPLVGGNVVFRSQGGKLDIGITCKICNQKHGE